MNRYRVEYSITGAETAGSGKKEFEAPNDGSAIGLMSEICRQITEERNKGIESEFDRFNIEPTRLLRIEQPEISTEILVIIRNTPSQNLADDPDFMGALADFQYGESGASEKGFQQMKEAIGRGWPNRACFHDEG